ncbi:MAG: hypothetical protein JO199_02600 [Candidatus Eremiobacteraeota bacterium]|nr:hypothetical protein [Candidatus Eremiobacteraeota bacterium]
MLRAVPAKPAIKGTLPVKVRRIPRPSERTVADVLAEPGANEYDLANATMLAAALGTGIYIDTFM